ncbi:hypothetical protein L5C66_29495, partial [Pseudomonas aeruginosa]|nr:hypothetical protein [Pseudomonas aeruginosa]
LSVTLVLTGPKEGNQKIPKLPSDGRRLPSQFRRERAPTCVTSLGDEKSDVKLRGRSRQDDLGGHFQAMRAHSEFETAPEGQITIPSTVG